MVKRYTMTPLALALGLAVWLSGCMGTGAQLSLNTTHVQLERDNYRIVAKDARGSAEVSYILGLSLPRGLIVNAFGLFRLDGTATLYGDAIADLWRDYEAVHGDIDGQSLALANIRYDSDVLNLLLYTKARVYVQADIVEFGE